MESDFFMEESLDMLVCPTTANEQVSTNMTINCSLIFIDLLKISFVYCDISDLLRN